MPVEGSLARNRRKHERYDVEYEVVLGNGMRNIKARLRDLSAGGAAVEWQDILETPDVAMPVGTMALMTFRTGVVVEAYVSALDGNTVHMTFDIADYDLQAILDRIREFTGLPLAAA